MSVAVFSSQHDADPLHQTTTWEEMTATLAAFDVRDVKDGPAWSPAEIGEGLRRGNDNVRAVHMLVLDLDHSADGGNLTSETLRPLLASLKPYEHAWHTSHSSSHPGAWRLRVVFPLTEPVAAEQWRPFLARAVQHLALPADPSCKDLSRLYFLPAAKPGSSPVAHRNRGAWLSPADILGMRLAPITAPARAPLAPSPVAADSAGPEALAQLRAALRKSKSENRALLGKILDGADILGPSGGHDPAINRAARIVSFVAANLSDKYSPRDIVTVLEPSLRNSSWGGPDDVCDYAETKVVRHLAECRAKVEQDLKDKALVEKTRAKFEHLDPAPAAESADGSPPIDVAVPGAAASTPHSSEIPDWASWTSKFVGADGQMAIVGTAQNIWHQLSFSPEWRGAFRRNLLTSDIEISDCPVYHGPPRILADPDVTRIAHYFASALEIEKLGSPLVYEQITAVAEQYAYDPVAEYLNSLQWDGVERLETWTRDLLGAPWTNDDGDDISETVRAVSKRWMVGAVARALQPGCKMDTTLVLEGLPDIGKSTAANILGGDRWFSDDAGNVLGDKDTKLQIASVWIQELPELASLSKATVEAIKAFMTRRIDRYRPPYGRSTVERPRRCVFIGSTNDSKYMVDDEGLRRRLWPIKVTKLDRDGLTALRDQLWAESVHRFRAGEQWHLTAYEKVGVAQHTAERSEEEPWVEVIDAAWERKGMPAEFQTRDALEWVGVSTDRVNNMTKRRVTRALEVLKFVQRRKDGARTGRRVWRKADSK